MRLRGAAPTRACGKLRGKAGGNCATRAQRAHSAPPGLRLAPEIRHLARALATASQVGCWDRSPAKIVMSHMNAASPRQSLVKGERLTRYELAAVMGRMGAAQTPARNAPRREAGAGDPESDAAAHRWPALRQLPRKASHFPRRELECWKLDVGRRAYAGDRCQKLRCGSPGARRPGGSHRRPSAMACSPPREGSS